MYASSASSCSNHLVQKPGHQEQRLIAEIEPFDWEFQESLQFYFQVVLPPLPAEAQKIPLRCFLNGKFPRELFKGLVISTQLERASKARGRVLRPGEDPAFQTSWARYFQSVSLHIDSINQLLRDDAKYIDEAPATFPIFQLLLFDLAVKQSSWKAHMALGALGGLMGPPLDGVIVEHYKGDFFQVAMFSGSVCLFGGLIAFANKWFTPQGMWGRS